MTTLSDRKTGESGTVKARILDRKMQPILTKSWRTPIGGDEKTCASASREISWPIPNDTSEGYFFVELTLMGRSGKQLSQQIYWQRILRFLADPEARRKWQAAPVPEPICTNGPWLKPQLAACPTTLSLEGVSVRAAGPEALITATVKNTGTNPAYPVTLSVEPDTAAVLWNDNYFWLPPGKSVTLNGTVRLDMRGLDPLSASPIVDPRQLRIHLAAWNAPESTLPAGALVQSEKNSRTAKTISP